MNPNRLNFRKQTVQNLMIIGWVGWAFIIAFLFFLATPAFADDVYLYVLFNGDSCTSKLFRTEMPTMGACIKVLEKAKTPEPKNVPGNTKINNAMWCGGDKFERNYNATWWRDPIKKHKGEN